MNALIEEENIVSIKLAEKIGFAHMESFDLDGKIMCRYVRDLT